MSAIVQSAAALPALHPLSTPQPSRNYRIVIGTAILTGLALVLFMTFSGELFRPARDAFEAGDVTGALLRPSLLWVTMGLLMLSVRTLLWFGYRPAESASYDDAPMLTVVIPAYNEGPMVEQSIEAVARARYPRDRLEILVVDDGSTDDTWHYIERAAKRHDFVTPLRLERNQGKRAALAAGFQRARGSILVTIDSDSVIEPETLLAIAGPFRNSQVGAVAGKVAAFNRDQGWLTRMLHVRYILSFDFQRSVQSTYGTVYCCPGALSAYRASVVREVLDAWLNQRFLGARCTFGEDRALTNAILAKGFDTVYQGSAVVHTVVPHTYAKLCKMYLRWDRSYVREELRFALIVWRRPLLPMLLSILEKAITNLRYPVAWIAGILLLSRVFTNPLSLVRVLVAIGIGASFYMLYYLYSERSLRFVHGILYAYFAFFTLWWIFPFAILTVRARSWLTR
ncbi:MAG: glycosyltransferase family 2 protein [Betaproteobacteria bacterium]|nr:MAG: glycosyltransferase family 2 protein [Betaproteobacteria bacterium]